ncbi:MAG TPA: preprotein translocase subunit SecE [Candidatus Polarisedimenticolaceae bacterium]|nr:preprotein translocase subunit SecE [Candidatus Polarisedimenticolaceae bacterium]
MMERFRRMKQFLVEVVSELKKTTWPGRREVYGTTVVVIVAVVICAVYLWVVDMVLGRAMNYVFQVFG